jgi:hypothetical protein
MHKKLSLKEKLKDLSILVDMVNVLNDNEVEVFGAEQNAVYALISKINFSLPGIKIRVTYKFIIDKNSPSSQLKFKNCVFTTEFRICEKVVPQIDFDKCIFNALVNFDGSNCRSSIVFNSCEFHNRISCLDVLFEKIIDFNNSTFYEDQWFTGSKFFDQCNFSKVTFKKAVQFLECKIFPDSFINFESTVFQGGLDLSRANFRTTQVNFWGALFMNPDEKSLAQLNWQERINSKASISEMAKDTPPNKLRETFRFIKQSFRSQGNNIEALQFHQYEMQAYEYELKTVGRFNEKAILFLNKTSNNFGLSWKQGVGFTFMVAAIFFIFMLLTLLNKLEFSCNIDALGLTIKNFFQLLNLTNWNYQPFGFTEINVYTYVILFVAKIFIGYGYYQTIQAFRKFGRN